MKRDHVEALLELIPLTPSFGAEIRGVDLTRAVPDGIFAALRQALFDHAVLLFREQFLTPAQEGTFMGRFGPLVLPDRRQFTLPEAPYITVLSNVLEDGKPIGFLNEIGVEWHTDDSGWERQHTVTALYAVETPEVGGDTLFAGTYRPVEEMPDELRRRVEGKVGIYNYLRINEKVNAISPLAKPVPSEDRARFRDVRHPLLRPHPVTGRPEELIRIEGMGERDSYDLVTELVAFATRDRYAYRHHYAAGDLILNDNSGSLHSTTEYVYRNERRIVHRSIAHLLRAEDVPAVDASHYVRA
jgi:taurine dioxygenase